MWRWCAVWSENTCPDKASAKSLNAFLELYSDAISKAEQADKEIQDAKNQGTLDELFEKKPLLGICLGMQMLFEKGYEFGETDGLGLIPGSVRLMHPQGELPVPQIGWNSLEKNVPCRLLDRCNDGEYVYFVHSYAAECDSKYVAAYCDYGMKVPALVFSGNVYGAQFHPEKSGETGLNILRCFAEL